MLSTRSSKSLKIYPIKTFFFFFFLKKGYESVNFCLRRARTEIRRPWTCSRSHTYMPCSDPQIHLLWPSSPGAGRVAFLCQGWWVTVPPFRDSEGAGRTPPGFVPLPGMVGYGATVPRFRGGGSDPPGAPCSVILGGWVGPPRGIILREFPYFT